MVEADAGSERERAHGDAGGEVAGCAGAVALEAEEVLAGEEDRLDPLPDGRQVWPPLGLEAPGRAQDSRAGRGNRLGELTPGRAPVADDRLPASQRAREQAERDLALGPIGAGERDRPRRPVGGAGEVQAHPPKPARVALRVAVAADLGKLRAAGGLERAAALERRRVEQDQVVAGARALGGEDAHQPLDRLGQPRPALVERVLAGQVVEEVAEPAAGGTQEATVGRDPQQHLGDAERDHLGVRQLAAGIAPWLGQEIVGRCSRH